MLVQLLTDEKANTDEVEKLVRWCLRALNSQEGHAATRGWVSFLLPSPRDHANLVPIVPIADDRHARDLRARRATGAGATVLP